MTSDSYSNSTIGFTGEASHVTPTGAESTDSPTQSAPSPTSGSESQSALDHQVGGTHYKDLPIQPIEFCFYNKLNNCQSEAISYITRAYLKGDVFENIDKAIHTLELWREMEMTTREVEHDKHELGWYFETYDEEELGYSEEEYPDADEPTERPIEIYWEHRSNGGT